MNEDILSKLEVEKWLELNSKLQQKKNKLRNELKEKGVLKKDKVNDFDHYQYFSEAQYKMLFTELFSKSKLELKFTELEYNTFEGTEKQSNGRMPKIEFKLIDVETGFYETTAITGEGIDKGDKAGYKAYTGALKYFLANTFMVATGDDAEACSPSSKMNNKKVQYATTNQIAIISKFYQGENLEKLLEANKIKKIEKLPITKASAIITALKKRTEEKNNVQPDNNNQQ